MEMSERSSGEKRVREHSKHEQTFIHFKDSYLSKFQQFDDTD